MDESPRVVINNCMKCDKPITQNDVDNDNGPTTIANMPGHVHRRCKAYFDIDIVGSGRKVRDLDIDKEGL